MPLIHMKKAILKWVDGLNLDTAAFAPWETGFDPSWSSLCHLGICSGTNLRLRRLVPIFYGIFELAGAQTQETEKLVIFWLQKK